MGTGSRVDPVTHTTGISQCVDRHGDVTIHEYQIEESRRGGDVAPLDRRFAQTRGEAAGVHIAGKPRRRGGA